MRLLLLIYTASPALANLVVPLFLIAPPFYTIGGAISFCLPIIMSSLLVPSADVVLICPHGRSCGFFWRFHTGPPVLCSLIVPLCLIRFILTRHAARNVIVPIAPLIVSSYCFSSPIAPPTRHDGRGGLLASNCGTFHVRTPWYNSRPRYSSNRSSLCLLAPSPLTAWVLVPICSAVNPPIRSAPIRPA